MEQIAKVLTSPMTPWVLLAVIAVIMLAMHAVRKGWLSYSGHGLSVGADEKERRIIQRQTTLIHGQLDAIANKMTVEHPEWDMYKTRWICKCAELEWVRSIHYNHVEDTTGYKDDRFIALRDIVQKKASDPYFFSSAFEEFMRRHVDYVVPQLVRIRKEA